MLGQQQRLSAEERREKQKIYLRDTVALCALAGLVVVLSFVTYGLFHSFAAHRRMLEGRWRARGEAALAAGQPVAALNLLHSALAYAPDDRGLQVELATALTAAGRTQEAQVYFTTLLEGEPGSGAINLQLARLAIRQGNVESAVDHYQAAIEGTWNGDAFTQRRDIRLELVRYLIAQRRYAEARELLLITSGNGPDNPGLQLVLGGLLEQAGDATDALDVYRKAVRNRPTRLEALEGEGHAAASLGRYAQARTYLAQAVGEQSFARQPQPVRDAVHAELETAEKILALYPADTLPTGERGHRIGHLAQLAQARLLACPAGATTLAPAPVAPPGTAQPLAALAAQLQQLNPLARDRNAPAAASPVAEIPPADPLAALAAQWAQMPAGPALEKQLTRDPVFAQNTLQLAYQTERATAGPCDAPTGEDALLERIARAPDQVEAQP